MNIYSRLSVWLLVIIVSLDTACAAVPAPAGPTLLQGQVEAIQTGTSYWVVREVLRGAPNAFAIGKDGMTLFAAPMREAGGWGTVALNLKSEMPLLEWAICSGGTGSFYGCSDMASLISRALEKGYDFISPDKLPAPFVREIMRAGSWISTVPLTILVMPIGVSDIPYDILPEPGVKE